MNINKYNIQKNIKEMSERKSFSKNLNSEDIEMYKINGIITNQNTKIERIHEFLSDVIDIYESYIKLSKDFSKKLENLAMKLKPDDKTFEGQIVQVFQSILLFNSNLLYEMIKDMNQFHTKESQNYVEIVDLNNFENFRNTYSEQYRKTLVSNKIYENSVTNLENNLIKKELGLVKVENKNNENIKMVYNNQEKYIKNIDDCNELLQNLYGFFSKEKNKMRMQIFNYCNKFNDSVMNFIKKQNETILNQKLILDNLTNIFDLKELEKKEFSGQYLKANPYPLKCLKLSEEKDSILENGNKLSLGQALNILQIFEDNGLILNQETKKKGKEENDKVEISRYIENLFNMNNIVYEDTEKQKMILLLNNKANQTYFLNILNDYRTKGKYIMGKYALQTMGYLFQYLNELLVKNVNSELFNQFLIMIFTFYYEEKYEKYYLYKYVENSDSYKNRKLWEDYLEGLILSDIKEDSSQDIDLNYIHFLNTMSVIKSMSDLHLGKELMDDFTEYTGAKYKLKDDQKIQLNYILYDNGYRPGSFNENERSTLSGEVNELSQSFGTNENRNSRNSRNSNNSNIIISKTNDNEESKTDSDGSVESIEIEGMTKK